MPPVRIRRTKQPADLLRNYRIYIDGVFVGHLGFGAELTVAVAPGHHTVVARIDWCRSNTVGIEVHEGMDCLLEVGSNLRGWRLLLVFLYITFWRTKYLYLQQVPLFSDLLDPRGTRRTQTSQSDQLKTTPPTIQERSEDIT
jgi:hypothetical protein